MGLFGVTPLAEATQVKIFRTEGAAGFLGGEMDGVSIDSLGRISLADRMERLSQIDEPFVFTAVESKGSWLVGTGNSGKVLRIDQKGEVTVLLDAEETEVFALFEDSDGAIYAGTSPSGKVYRIPPRGGEAEVAFDPGETYIWAIARDAKGKLLVATGPRGRLYAVDKKGEGEVLYDSLEPHLRSLLAHPGGGALVGTAGEGRILRIAEDGTPRTLHDALQPEIVALTPGPKGSFFAAALATEASAVNLSTSDSGSNGSSKEEAKEGETASSSESSTFSATGSRPASFSGARSEVLSISKDGAIESLGSFKEETVYSLLWHGGRLWIGTGQEGKLYSYRDGEMVLEKSCDEKQLVALLPGAEGPAIVTGNPATLYRTLPGTERTGTYTSAVLDAVQVSRLGSFRWIGQAPKQSGVAVSFRTGLSSDPDETWSPWSAPRSGTELSLGDLQKGRFVQWRAELKADDGRAPRMDAVEISYLQQNQKPEISELSVLDPGQVLVPANFNPSNQVFEPAHPNRDGIFTTLNASGRGEARVKTLWKLGYRSLRWQASDANQDPLTYSLSFRPAASEDDAWLTMVEDLDESQYSFDATVLPDGVYRFRLVASDEGGNNRGEALAVEKVSGPVVVDHSPPEARTVRASGELLEVEVRDAWNPLREALVSVDAGEWKPVPATDGLVDGRKELLKVQRPKDARLLLLRLTDAAHNVVTIDLLEESS